MKQLQQDFILSRKSLVWNLSVYNEKNKIDYTISSMSLGDILQQLDKLKKAESEKTLPLIIINKKKIKK